MKSGEWVKQQQQYIKCRLISYQPIDGVGNDFLNKWSALYWLFGSTILISPQPSPAAHPQGSICNPMAEGEDRRYFLQKNTKSRRNQCHALCPSLIIDPSTRISWVGGRRRMSNMGIETFPAPGNGTKDQETWVGNFPMLFEGQIY